MLLQGRHTSCYKDTPHKKINFQQLLFDFTWNKTDPAFRYGGSPLFEWLKTGGCSQRCQQWASSRRNRGITDLLFTNIQHLDKHWNTKSIQCMQTLSLYNESFLLISMKLQKKSHYIISLKMCVVKKIRCSNNCSSYLRATWFLSRLLVPGRLTHITVNFWQTITFMACDRARVVTRRLCPGCHSSKSIGFSAIHR